MKYFSDFGIWVPPLVKADRRQRYFKGMLVVRPLSHEYDTRTPTVFCFLRYGCFEAILDTGGGTEGGRGTLFGRSSDMSGIVDAIAAADAITGTSRTPPVRAIRLCTRLLTFGVGLHWLL